MAATRRHLLDPNNLPAPSPRAQQSLSRVQKWVLSSLAVTTILHLVAGLILAAVFMDAARQSSRIGLLVIAGAFGVIAIAAGLAIHQRRLLSPWLLLGTIPAAGAAIAMF